MTTIDTVCLDAGGVLLFPNWTRVQDALERHGVDADAAVLARADFLAKRRMDVPEMFDGTTDQQRGWPYFNLVLTEAGIPLSDATDAALAELHAYHAAHNLWESVPDDVVPALNRLRAMGLRLVVISNANGTLQRCVDRVGLGACLDTVVDSHLEGVEKPDPRLFHLALARAGARADSAIHVGDIYNADVVGARRAGLRPVLLDKANLYPDVDCPRVRSLDALADGLRDKRWES